MSLLQTNSYSIIVDESTDVSTTKQLAIVVRVVNSEKCSVHDKFLQLIDVKDSSAEGLFQHLSKFFLRPMTSHSETWLALLLIMLQS